MTLLHRHSTARAAPPAPLPEMVFHGLAPDENAQMQGVVLGTGDLVAARTSSIYTPDMDGVDREFIDVQPGISGARTDLDPAKYGYLVIVTSETPDPMNMAIDYFVGDRTSRYKYVEPGGDIYYTSKVADAAYTTGRPPDGTEISTYIGDDTEINRVYCENKYCAGSIDQWFAFPAARLHIANNRFTGAIAGLENVPSMSRWYMNGSPNIDSPVPSLAALNLIGIMYLSDSNFTSAAVDFAWHVGGGISICHLYNCAIPSDGINAILIAADAEEPNGTSLDLRLEGGTNGAPTGAGITAMNSLIAKGASVTTN